MGNYEIFPGERTPPIKVTWSKLELKICEFLILRSNDLTHPNPGKI